MKIILKKLFITETTDEEIYYLKKLTITIDDVVSTME